MGEKGLFLRAIAFPQLKANSMRHCTQFSTLNTPNTINSHPKTSIMLILNPKTKSKL